MKTNIKNDEKLLLIRDQVVSILHGKKRLGNKVNDIMDIVYDMRDWTYEKTKEANSILRGIKE